MDTLAKVIHDTVGAATGTAGDDGPTHNEVLAEERRRQAAEEKEKEKGEVEEERRQRGEEIGEKEREETMLAGRRRITGLRKGDWILLTGASGFVAAHVLSALLDAGYNVKCTVTSAAEADNIRKHRPLHSAHLALAVATDAAVPGAFDDAVTGVKGVIHMASPSVLPDRTDNRLDAAIQGTTSLLTSILQHNAQCRRVVVASDVAAVLSAEAGMRPGYTYNELDWNPITYEEAVHACRDVAYGASKTVAERAAWDFMEKHTSANSISRPAFSLATVCCPMVYGPIEHRARLDTLNASTADIYRLINGSERSVPETKLHAWVDVRDAAEGYVRALEAAGKPAGMEDRYLVAAGGYSYTEVCRIIQKRFPHLVNTGLTPNPAGAPLPPPHYTVDNSKSVRELGMSYRPLEACIVDVVHSLLKLHADEDGEDGEEKQHAPISVTDVRTGREHRSRSLVGTGLTVCECGGNMGVCSCSPSTCACRGCARKSWGNPTARVAQHGPKRGMGAVPKEWREIGDLGVSGLGPDEQASAAACGCVDPATCGKAATGVCFYSTVGASTYQRSENDRPARAASDYDRNDDSPTPMQHQSTRRASLPAAAAPLVPVSYAAPEEMAPLIVPDTSVCSSSGAANADSPAPVTASTTASVPPATAPALAEEPPSTPHLSGGLFAELQRASPFSPTKCCCPRKNTPTEACTCTPAAQDCPCGGHEKNVRECAVPPDTTVCTCACAAGEERGGTCSCESACAGCEHCTERGMRKPSVVLNV